jgi:putative DNA primase/helicase
VVTAAPVLNDHVLSQGISIGFDRENYADVDTIDAEDRPRLLSLTLRELSAHAFPERRPILSRGETPVFRAGHLGELYAERGFGKSWFAYTLGLVAASGGEAIGFRAPEPCRVLYVDGEMASREIQERMMLLCERLGIPLSVTLSIVAADWQDGWLSRLDTLQGQTLLEPHVEGADLIIIDNRSCLFDPEAEKDPVAWQPAQDWLLSLRRRGKAVLVVHHSNRLGGARGHSKAEDPMNLLIKLTRPEDYRQDQGARFLVTFDKLRGAYGSAVAPFLAQLGPNGWTVESATEHREASVSDKLLEYLTLAHEAGERPKSANAAIRGAHVNRSEGLRAWAELVKAGTIRKHHDGGWFCGR